MSQSNHFTSSQMSLSNQFTSLRAFIRLAPDALIQLYQGLRNESQYSFCNSLKRVLCDFFAQAEKNPEGWLSTQKKLILTSAFLNTFKTKQNHLGMGSRNIWLHLWKSIGWVNLVHKL